MGAIPGMLGLGGGSQGSGVSGPAMPGLGTVVKDGQVENAYNGAQIDLAAQQSLLQALQGQNGLGNQSQVYNQLQGVATGQGPNPAQAQYQQNIQDLAKQQSGALSSVQGISPALATRMISQQGSAAMQNAAGQGAANLANQQLGAMTAAGNMANTQAGQQIGQVNQNAASQIAEQQALFNAASGQNQNLASAQGNVNSANQGILSGIQNNQGKIIGGVMNGAGKAAATGAEGGMITPQGFTGPASKFAQHLASAPMMAMGGKVPALVSPGEGWLPPAKVQQVANGKDPLKVMERIPGKPKVPGNSYANDIVPKDLEAGGVIIPNNIMQSKNPAKGARDMVAGIIAKRKGRK